MGTTDVVAIAFVIIAAAGITLAVLWDRRERRRERCDRLILAGHPDQAPRRVAALEAAKRRQKLADDLRWHLVAAGRDASPLGRAERRALLDHSDAVRMMAAAVESAPVDPAALVLLEWVVSGPPPREAATDAQAGEELSRRLEQAQALIAGRPGTPRYSGRTANAALS